MELLGVRRRLGQEPVLLKARNFLLFICISGTFFLTGDITNYLSFLSAVLVHELGHAVCALLVGLKIKSVDFGAFGIRMNCDYSGVPAVRIISVSAAGPLFGIAASLAATSEWLAPFSASSLALSVFNLLPVSTLDGGMILKTAADSIMLPDRSYRLCKAFGIASVIFVFALCVRTMLRGEASFPLLACTVYMIFTGVIGG